MSYQQIKQFVYAAKHGNITKASKELFMTQQALSHSILNMEKELGVKLFQRSMSGVMLTEFGSKIYPRSAILVEQVEDFEGFLKDQALLFKEVSIVSLQGESDFLCFPHSLLEKYRDDIRLTVSHDFTNSLRALEKEEVSIAFGQNPRDSIDEELEYYSVIHERPLILLNEKHPLANNATITILDIISEPIILPSTAYTLRRDIINAYGKYGVQPKFTVETPSIPVVLESIRQGDGIKYCTSYAIPSYDLRGIRVLSIDESDAADILVDRGFLSKKNMPLSNCLASLISDMQEYYRREN